MGATVSVIVPCHNYGHLLERCVQSVLDQSGVDVEVLVLDDASTDDTPVVGERLAGSETVTFRRHDRNRGHIATYNEGLDWAEGDYTVVLSADDLLTPGSLERATAVLDRMPSVGMLYGCVVRFQDEPPAPRRRTGRVRVWDGHAWIAERCTHATNTIASPEVVVRTSMYKELGGYREDLPHTGDLEMWIRVASRADIAYLHADQAYYRLHPKSMSRTTYRSSLADLVERRACFDVVFEGYGRDIPNAVTMHESARKALATEALWRASRAYDCRRIDVVPTDVLEGFATETYPAATRLREFRALASRRRVGPRWSPVAQFVRPSVYAHRARTWLSWHRVYARGV